MSDKFCSARSITFSYENQIEPLFDGLSFTLPRGWSGIVGPNGGGKTTLVRLLAGELEPTRGAVERPDSCHYCAQSTGSMPEELLDLLASPDADDYETVRQLGVEYDWPYRWGSLSFGERKRAQVAAALFTRPDLLVLDEPTNHLDAEAVASMSDALERYDGIGVIISHDRDLLDRLCKRCLFLGSGRATLRPGGVSAGLAEADREAQTARRERLKAKEELVRLTRETAARRTKADAADAKRSKRKIALKDHDAKGRIDLARVTGKDGVAGKLLGQMQHRIAAAESRLNEATAPPFRPTGITLSGSEARRDFLFRLGPSRLPLGEERALVLPELSMGPKDRVAITGPNGSGKSTCIGAIVAELRTESYLYLAQELSHDDVEELHRRLASLDSKARGEVLSAVKRLGSEPERLLETSSPSPGEARKLLLALAMSDETELIIMDEPTNHMDLPSILCLEEALAACPSALLFVTHDNRFASRLAAIRWVVRRDGERDGLFHLSVT